MLIHFKISNKVLDFQAFNPIQITLIPNKNNIANLDFTKLDNSGEKQKLVYYFDIDTCGNVSNRLEL